MVNTVIIDGQTVLENKQLLVCDEQEILQNAKTFAQHYWATASAFRAELAPAKLSPTNVRGQQELPRILGRGVCYLSVLGIANSGMDVHRTLSALLQNCPLAVHQSLAHHTPMAKVTGQLHLWKLRHQVPRNPGVKERSTAMSFKTDVNA